MNTTRKSDNPDPTVQLQTSQERILASLLTEGARLRTRRTRRRILTGTGIAACALALTWAALLTYSDATNLTPTAPGTDTTPKLASATGPSHVGQTNAAAKSTSAVIVSAAKPQISAETSVQLTDTFNAVWKIAHNQPGGFKTITTEQLLTRINTNGKSFGLIELGGTMLIVSNDRAALHAQ